MREHAREGESMVPCEVAVAQSIVFHALEFAYKLGFEPHRDFQPSMFAPRPAELLETAGCRPERPDYRPRQGDEIAPVVLPADQRELLLDALAIRAPELVVEIRRS